MSEIVVNDRRLFSKDGSLKTESQEGTQESTKEEAPKPPKQQEPKEAPAAQSSSGESYQSDPRASQAQAAQDAADRAATRHGHDGLPVTLSAFIVGLATSALMQMGEKISPDQPDQGPKDLTQAKQTIDLLGILEKKTKGNLDPEEESLLSTFLYDLRMRFISLASKK
jgi:hypothetical protein